MHLTHFALEFRKIRRAAAAAVELTTRGFVADYETSRGADPREEEGRDDRPGNCCAVCVSPSLSPYIYRYIPFLFFSCFFPGTGNDSVLLSSRCVYKEKSFSRSVISCGRAVEESFSGKSFRSAVSAN